MKGEEKVAKEIRDNIFWAAILCLLLLNHCLISIDGRCLVYLFRPLMNSNEKALPFCCRVERGLNWNWTWNWNDQRTLDAGLIPPHT